MDKQFSIVINSQQGGYVAVLRCFTINEEGHQITVDSKIKTGIPTASEALELAAELIKTLRTDG